MPKKYRDFAIAVNFGLNGIWYIARDTANCWLLNSGEWARFHIAHLHEVGPVIGPRDLEAASHRAWAEGWRESMHASISDRLNLPR
jgi:hypothetical protein